MKKPNQQKRIDGVFDRVLETSNRIFYINFDEADKVKRLRMYTRKRRLSKDIRAPKLFQAAIESEEYTWISNRMAEELKSK